MLWQAAHRWNTTAPATGSALAARSAPGRAIRPNVVSRAHFSAVTRCSGARRFSWSFGRGLDRVEAARRIDRQAEQGGDERETGDDPERGAPAVGFDDI